MLIGKFWKYIKKFSYNIFIQSKKTPDPDTLLFKLN